MSKSLEFINKDLQDFEKALENYKKRKAINNEEVDEEYIKQMTKEIENYKHIKQDLEVLEMLKKLFGDMEIDIWHSKRFHKTIGEIRFSGTDFAIDVEDFGITLENLQKLKQWLENNKVGDYND